MRKWNVTSAMLLILPLLAVTDVTGQKGILFPEISALALGPRVMENPRDQHKVRG